MKTEAQIRALLEANREAFRNAKGSIDNGANPASVLGTAIRLRIQIEVLEWILKP